ncbi:integrase catalytic domain-containing protein, partial [Nephila pilipes]
MEMRRQVGIHDVSSSVRSWMKIDPEGIKVAENENGDIIGIMGLSRNHPDLYCGGFYCVHEKYRNLNIGSKGLVERLKRDPVLYEKYREVFDGYLEEGLAEWCMTKGLADESSFYLPQNAVVREDKVSSRLRIIFFRAAHKEGQYSLSYCLTTGINFYPNLFELLIKFRENAVAYTADIRHALLRISIDTEDRRFTRVFGTENFNSNQIIVMNFTCFLFGLTPSPYLLAATLKFHFEQYRDLFPETCETILKSFWIDDLVGGTEQVETALKITTETEEIFKNSGMVLRKWQTKLREAWRRSSIQTQKGETIEVGCGALTKVPVLAWDPDKDMIFFGFSKLIKILANGYSTNRFILQILVCIFDPIGFMRPFIISLKILLQELR